MQFFVKHSQLRQQWFHLWVEHSHIQDLCSFGWRLEPQKNGSVHLSIYKREILLV